MQIDDAPEKNLFFPIDNPSDKDDAGALGILLVLFNLQ
jgi:hypothetical protein